MKNIYYYQAVQIQIFMIYLLFNYLENSMELLTYNAKDFIKNVQHLTKYQCGICYDICIDPVKCKGSCQQIYCMRCVSQSKHISNKCPKRCSEPFRVVKLSQFDIQFQCPYSKECNISIRSLSDFNHHFQVCKFISPLQLYKKSSKKQYKCMMGHSLQFYTDKFYEMVSSICSQCKQLKLCRSICRKCQEKYCVQCRTPPCSKKYCPIGHRFEIFQNQLTQYICDICGFNAWSYDDKIFDDKICNFGICKSCHDQLPQQIDNSAFKNLQNAQQKCECGQQLKIRQQKLIKNCSSCNKIKKCPKYCQSCDKNYCLKCKVIYLLGNNCQQQHQYILVQTQEESQGCMNCNEENKTYYKDQICGFIFCQKCKKYFGQITSDKQRIKNVQCQKKHLLFYIKNYKGKNICSKCKQLKKSPLVCCNCQEYYCLQCKIIQLKSCYYSHPLKDCLTVSPSVKCDVCHIEKVDKKECRKCQLSVCSECIQKSCQTLSSQ